MISNVSCFFKKGIVAFCLAILLVFIVQSVIAKPRVSIITSVFKGDEFIEGFLENTVEQTMFKDCELILINANSPHNEEPIIKKYMEQYPNIVYKKLDQDPGLYAVWNMAIKMAQAELVGNANLDDRRNLDSLEKQVEMLEQDSAIDLVYGDILITLQPCDQVGPTSTLYRGNVEEFAPHKMSFCLPGPQPVWRKSMHQKYGFFKEDFFSSADWEMWLRAVSQGSVFKKIPNCILGIYYQNPVGISTDQDAKKTERRNAENAWITEKYSYLWEKSNSAEGPLLLIKIPTRSRPEQFFKILDLYYQKLSGELPYRFLITCDTDDSTMNCPAVIAKLNSYENLSYSFNNNTSKVEAYNRDVNEHAFDILLVTSDDMEPVMDKYDQVIAQRMQEAFPDFDGVLNFNDGYVGAQCNTLPVIGKKYYDRFGYVYHPEYKSLYCDEELAFVSKILRKEKVCSEVIIKHNHPAWGAGNWDALYATNEGLKSRDKAIFDVRREHGFFLSKKMVQEAMPKTLSILICTLEERKESFDKLIDKLYKQIHPFGVMHDVEIIYFKDNRENTVGFKRNELLRASSGKYVCFLDDDDDVHDRYIEMIYTALQKDTDCVSLHGIISHHGEHKKEFIHSLKYNSYFEKDGKYYRPPNHLNPIKRSIAIQFNFPELNHAEDYQWAMALTQSRLLKTETVIDTPYYFYQCSDNPLNRYY